MTNFLWRFITASILIPLVILAVFYLKPTGFLWLSFGVFVLAGWEWSLLSGIKNTVPRLFYVGVTVLVLYASLSIPIKTLLVLGGLLWVMILINFFQYSLFFVRLSGFVSLAVCWQGINYLCFLSPHPWKLIDCFVIVWLSDMAAYFIGRQWGKHKLAPFISPNKTIEGALGGLVIVGVAGVLLFHSLSGVLISLITAIAGIIGDLYESQMKRHQQLKDSGKILPGHGGILDRIDSLLAAVPIFGLGVYFLHF